LAQVLAVELGQVDRHDDGLLRRGHKELEGLPGVLGHVHGIARLAEHRFEVLPRRRVLLGEENRLQRGSNSTPETEGVSGVPDAFHRESSSIAPACR
jgi:hypothetical protein